MHVLPLPFGLALALIPRREADRFRDNDPRACPIRKDGPRARADPRRHQALRRGPLHHLMRSETYSTPGPLRLNLEIPAGEIEIETGNTDETHVELEAVANNDAIRDLVENSRIELVRRGDGHEVIVEAKARQRHLHLDQPRAWHSPRRP